MNRTKPQSWTAFATWMTRGLVACGCWCVAPALSTILLCGGALTGPAAADVALVQNSVSRHCIYRSPNAPASVVLAAEELQQFIRKATAAVLPIVATVAPPGCPFVSVGINAAQRAAGIDTAGLPLEGYRITTRGTNLYLVGNDTADGQRTPQGGSSAGTLNAAYTFIEEVLGVRWLMPGEIGEHVPQRRSVVVPSRLNRIEGPGFASRRIAYVQNDNQLVKQWLRRLKQGSSIDVNDGHAWHDLVPSSDYNQHPEWFAMIGGARQPPVGDRYKLETTDPALVRTVAERLVANFKANPQRYTNSISPTDSGNWSNSPQSQALFEKDPYGKTSMTRLVLSFYTDVAGQVQRQMPDRKLCGFIYDDYLYPPTTGVPVLPGNLCLVVAPQFSYAYGLSRPNARDEWEKITKAWSAPGETRIYYDLPTVFFPDPGVPQPLGTELLKFIYPRIAAAGYSGTYVYGATGWGHGAVTNYLLAKLNWNPKADVDALVGEFLGLAYGQPAARALKAWYARLDATTVAHYARFDGAADAMDVRTLANVYAPARVEMHEVGRLAGPSPGAEPQKRRLALYLMAVAELYSKLVREKLMRPGDVPAALATLPDVAASELAGRADVKLAVAPRRRLEVGPISVSAVAPVPRQAPATGSPFLLRGRTVAVLHPDRDGEIEIEVTRLERRGEEVRYDVFDADHKPISSGFVDKDGVIKLTGRDRRILFVDFSASSASFHLEVKGAAFALHSSSQPSGIQYHGHFPTTYFHVPDGFGPFSITISTESIAETAAADVLDPAGRVVASLDTSDQLSVRARLVGGPAGGFWTVSWKKPRRGANDDVWVALDARLAPWVVLTPQRPLRIMRSN